MLKNEVLDCTVELKKTDLFPSIVVEISTIQQGVWVVIFISICRVPGTSQDNQLTLSASRIPEKGRRTYAPSCKHFKGLSLRGRSVSAYLFPITTWLQNVQARKLPKARHEESCRWRFSSARANPDQAANSKKMRPEGTGSYETLACWPACTRMKLRHGKSFQPT